MRFSKRAPRRLKQVLLVTLATGSTVGLTGCRTLGAVGNWLGIAQQGVATAASAQSLLGGRGRGGTSATTPTVSSTPVARAVPATSGSRATGPNAASASRSARSGGRSASATPGSGGSGIRVSSRKGSGNLVSTLSGNGSTGMFSASRGTGGSVSPFDPGAQADLWNGGFVARGSRAPETLQAEDTSAATARSGASGPYASLSNADLLTEIEHLERREVDLLNLHGISSYPGAVQNPDLIEGSLDRAEYRRMLERRRALEAELRRRQST